MELGKKKEIENVMKTADDFFHPFGRYRHLTAYRNQ